MELHMKLYGMQQSRSFRCLWALEESGLEYKYAPIKLRTNENEPDSAQNPDYLAINVQGKVPTLIDGNMTLTESVAILNHIARSAFRRYLASGGGGIAPRQMERLLQVLAGGVRADDGTADGSYRR